MLLPAKKTRLAIIVSHPIQYYVPLYRSLAQRGDVDIKVFFTWHAGNAAVLDHGFKKAVAWDIPLTEGYEYELVPNTSSEPGTHRFGGLKNPSLVTRVLNWQPDAVHITGWAWFSHMKAMWAFSKRGMPTLFRGDSHLLDSDRQGFKWWIKHTVLRQVFSWPAAFLYVGKANRAYYETFGVKADRLCFCPHSIDVARFTGSTDDFERKAARWRAELEISHDQTVILFAGKFERNKRPLELMQTMMELDDPRLVLVLVGNGELEGRIKAIADENPDKFRVLPFQNQSLMPTVYRLGDLFALPSTGETWGLAVNEALACGRPVLVSDRVGCAADVVDASCGRIFPYNNLSLLGLAIKEMTSEQGNLIAMREAALRRGWIFDVAMTEETLIRCLARISVA
jgi:glycosyltransferase involved in cell wall biosynthesis